MKTNTALKDRVLPVTLAEKSALDRLVDMVKQNNDKPFCGDFSKFERELKQRLLDVGKEVVAQELAKGAGRH